MHAGPEAELLAVWQQFLRHVLLTIQEQGGLWQRCLSRDGCPLLFIFVLEDCEPVTT